MATPIVLRGNTFGGPGQGNVSDDEGGAVFIDAFFRQVIVEDNTFADNVADEDGGGLSVNASQSITLNGNDFLRNEAGEEGGGATIDTCTADITANVFDSNRLTQVEDSLTGGGLLLSGNVCRNAQSLRGAAPVSTSRTTTSWTTRSAAASASASAAARRSTTWRSSRRPTASSATRSTARTRAPAVGWPPLAAARSP